MQSRGELLWTQQWSLGSIKVWKFIGQVSKHSILKTITPFSSLHDQF